MASGASRIKRGAVTGTGATITVADLGYPPKTVELYNMDGNCQAIWMEGMADASMQKIVDSGAGATDISVVTSGGITPTSTGFTLGTDADLNASGELIRWICSD